MIKYFICALIRHLTKLYWNCNVELFISKIYKKLNFISEMGNKDSEFES
jgi:hypothetical protein